MTPQASNITQIAEMAGTLDGNQTRALRDMLNESMGNQMRMVPEFFGDVARSRVPTAKYSSSLLELGVDEVINFLGQTLCWCFSNSSTPTLPEPS